MTFRQASAARLAERLVDCTQDVYPAEYEESIYGIKKSDAVLEQSVARSRVRLAAGWYARQNTVPFGSYAPKLPELFPLVVAVAVPVRHWRASVGVPRGVHAPLRSPPISEACVGGVA